MYKTSTVCVLAAAAALSVATANAEVVRQEIDGRRDDMLTAGLGLAGLQNSTPPGFVDNAAPTREELRRRSIYQSYRALIDLTSAGGAGALFGPRPGEKFAGVEFRELRRLPSPLSAEHEVVVQLPADFDLTKPCLVAAAASGSRGVYGALPIVAEWGLRRRCALVYTDKGAGNRFNYRDDSSWLATPHAHSGHNIEALWGDMLVDAARFAFAQLNAELGQRLRKPLTPANTIVIAAGISNGGGAALRALEADRGPRRQRWFDAAVAAEPNVSVSRRLPVLNLDSGQGANKLPVLPLYRYSTLLGLLQPCALLAETATPWLVASGATLVQQGAALWCADLHAHGEVKGDTAQAQAADARTQLLAAGVRSEALPLAAFNVQALLWTSVNATYASAYLRRGPRDMPCDLGLMAVDAAGAPRRMEAAELLRVLADGSGIPPTAGVMLTRRDAPGAAGAFRAALPETARCLRALAPDAGLGEIEMSADPGDRPVIVIHGRSDGLVHVNHSSRAWYAATLLRSAGRTRYYELINVQHFDAFLGLPDFGSRFLPMQPYLLRALDDVFASLAKAAPLAPSQVVRARPRGAAALNASLLGGWTREPAAADKIERRGGTLHIPD